MWVPTTTGRQHHHVEDHGGEVKEEEEKLGATSVDQPFDPHNHEASSVDKYVDDATSASSGGGPNFLEVCVIGAGFSGIATAYHLKQAAIEPFLVFEKRHEVGGTWSSNTYPGCACDIPSHLYSFSFYLNPNWSRFYPQQAEILSYLKSTVSCFGLTKHIRLNTCVIEAHWRPRMQRWEITTTTTATTTGGGDQVKYYARFLVIGAGLFGVPHYPNDIPGIKDFAGPTFHSSSWRCDVDLKGKHVSVIGTGASAIQFIPAIQPIVGKLTVFQRTPPWVFPKHDFAFSEATKRFLSRNPFALRAIRQQIYFSYEHLLRSAVLGANRLATKVGESRCKGYMCKHIKDPALRKALTPKYTLGCKRVLVSNDYYEALARPNVKVVTSGISAVTREGVVDQQGVSYPTDVLIYGTGFKVMDLLSGLHVVGEGDKSLHETWKTQGQGHGYGYLGMTVNGFPNMMILYGPNTNLGHNSVVLMIESQVNYLISCLTQMRSAGVTSFHLKADVEKAYQEEMERRSAKTIWIKGGCDSYYLDHKGDKKVNAHNWPGTVKEYIKRTRHCHLSRDYDLTTHHAASLV